MKTYLFLTVDTEASGSGNVPLSKMVYGKINGYYGISWIMDICEKYDFKATFFVDVYEYHRSGEKDIRKICETIHDRGHDVQLHIHPVLQGKRRLISDYSVQEQIELIREAKDLLHKWLGEYPIAYRGGDFGVNFDTLRALQANQIPIDSSLLCYPECKLSSDSCLKNTIHVMEGVIEIPVTIFTELKFGPLKRYRAFDINANTLGELKHVIKIAVGNHLSALVMLLHSFSFIGHSKDKRKYWPDYDNMRKFDRFLHFLKTETEIEVTTIKNFYHQFNEKLFHFPTCDYIPHSGYVRTLARSLKYFNHGWKNKLLVLVSVIFFTIVFFLIYASVSWFAGW